MCKYPVLPEDSESRKETPIFSGVLNYFPLAVAAVARHSKQGNDKHNPGQPLHWSRGKSRDHADCIARHLIDYETIDADGRYAHAAGLAWRALALLQELEENRLEVAMSRGSRLDEADMAGFGELDVWPPEFDDKDPDYSDQFYDRK
jgi:hypothetical protein